ncbi:MAG TPA: coenzyme F420-0:L-glutamate ligase [Acidimicrobiia bacterium]|nr:coenzyme F420-0:L-glutamate ligase [Acidimicrobiia bacterium]
MVVEIFPVPGLPDIEPGNDLTALLVEALAPLHPRDGDILVVTHKVVSKAEGAIAPAATEEDYRNVVASEATSIVRRRGDMVIAVTRHGFVCANAGVDRSNVTGDRVVLLPRDPDRSAHRIRTRLHRDLGVDLAVVISDTFGRAWRTGVVDVAIGISGIRPILDLKGTTDMHGRVLEVTEVAIADEVAAAAELAMGKSTGIAAALVRGVAFEPGIGRASELVRNPAEDMFR